MSLQLAKWIKKEPPGNELSALQDKSSTDTQDDINVLQILSDDEPDVQAVQDDKSVSVLDAEDKDLKSSLSSSYAQDDYSSDSELENIEQGLSHTLSNDIDKPGEILINHNDPHSWPPINNKLIYSLVEHGPDQGENFKSAVSMKSCRKFTKDWFYVKQINGETVKRKWIIYSINQNSVFCFPCMLFGHNSHNMTDPQKGFHDWQHLHPVIPQHENSCEHRNNYM